jgi:alkylation response protein AidB-like acyl-CoA dehydrogenase
MTDNGEAQLDASLLRNSLSRRLSTAAPGDAWTELAESGALDLCVPEQHGGAGLTVADSAPVFDVLGDLCLPTRYLETAVVATRLLNGIVSAEGERLLRKLSDPGYVIALSGFEPGMRSNLKPRLQGERWTLSGTVHVTIDGAAADAILIIVPRDDTTSLFLVEPGKAEVTARAYPTIDGRNAADLTFNEASCTLLCDDCTSLLSSVMDEAIACLAVEAAALMARLVEVTADYVKDRQQFGQPLSKFQVIQHRIVDMHIAARRAGAIARRAMAALDGEAANRSAMASAAKATIAETGRFVGQQAVQLHGGMGMTDELPVGRYFKRLTVIEYQLGDRDKHLTRYAEAAAADR